MGRGSGRGWAKGEGVNSRYERDEWGFGGEEKGVGYEGAPPVW